MNIIKVAAFTIRNNIGDEISLSESEMNDLPRQCRLVNPTKEDVLPDEPCAPWMLAVLTNRKIDAIKLIREKRGLGLKEAKDAVEYFAEKMFLFENEVVHMAKTSPKDSYAAVRANEVESYGGPNYRQG